MSVITIEHLPNELCLEIFVYFTWSELNSTWIKWRLNSRIERLALMAQSRVALEMSSMSLQTWSEWSKYFEDEHFTIAHRITSLVLNEAILSGQIIERWFENGSSFFPRIRRCTVFVHLIEDVVLSNLLRLIHHGKSTLRRLILFFNQTEMYKCRLRQILEHRISLHTMQLVIIKGNKKKQIFLVSLVQVGRIVFDTK